MANENDELVAIPFKHVFLDIVGFTKDSRPVKDQIAMVDKLNHAVREVVNERLNGYQHLLIPTGDGMCISIMEMKGARSMPFDIHLTVALEVLRLLHFQNAEPLSIRIGISDVPNDSLVTDIKGSLNVIGDGINLAQRIMNGADENVILMSKRAHAELVRGGMALEQFKQYWLVVKHNVLIEVYQFIDAVPGLSTHRPEGVIDPPVNESEPSDIHKEPSVIELHAHSFSDADDRTVSISITEASTLTYSITGVLIESQSHVFYFHVRTALDEKGWIGFFSGPGEDFNTGAERTLKETETEGPDNEMNVRELVRRRWPEFRGDVVEINRLRLRGSSAQPTAVSVKVIIQN